MPFPFSGLMRASLELGGRPAPVSQVFARDADCGVAGRPGRDRAHNPSPWPVGTGRVCSSINRPASGHTRGKGRRTLSGCRRSAWAESLPGLRHRTNHDVRERVSLRDRNGLSPFCFTKAKVPVPGSGQPQFPERDKNCACVSGSVRSFFLLMGEGTYENICQAAFHGQVRTEKTICYQIMFFAGRRGQCQHTQHEVLHPRIQRGLK